MPGFHIENFGCRAARADGEAVCDRLRTAGHLLRPFDEADIVIVNTCSVTAEADRSARSFIRRVKRKNPATPIVVTGCYAQRAPEELAALQGVSAVVGNSHKALVAEIALHLVERPRPRADVAPSQMVSLQSIFRESDSGGKVPIWADDRFAHSFIEDARILAGAQTRPNLKIQEGCGNRCTFCVIPQTRGFSRSLAAASVLKQVHGFVASGGQELVLSGINLGRWGRDLPAPQAQGSSALEPRTLAALLSRIFAETALPRLRLSSIEPMDWDRELMALMAEFGGTRLARHAHLPLQSGSDAVLRRMHRRYRPWHYEEKVWGLAQAVGPELTVGADVMVGFPGETDEEFRETLEFVRRLPFGYLHLFPFSPRPGTAGWALHAANPVPVEAVEERMAALRKLAQEKSRNHRALLIGMELDAITLQSPPELASAGRTAALTENFLPVELEGRLTANRMMRIRLRRMKASAALEAEPASLENEQAETRSMAF